jgi:hypothetical protein
MAKTKLGRQLIKALTELRNGIRTGKPFKQSIVRRIPTKRGDVLTRETYTAPIGKD